MPAPRLVNLARALLAGRAGASGTASAARPNRQGGRPTDLFWFGRGGRAEAGTGRAAGQASLARPTSCASASLHHFAPALFRLRAHAARGGQRTLAAAAGAADGGGGQNELEGVEGRLYRCFAFSLP